MNPLITLRRTISFIAAVVVLLIQSIGAEAQLNVTPNQTALLLAQKLAGTGVIVSNATLTCPTNANGLFANALSPLGVDSGILLTTGQVVTNNNFIGVNGAASTLASRDNAATGDAQLTTLAGQVTYDACKLEFDFVPAGDSIKFGYVFSSEEYTLFSCSPYNDVFGFFISGPGITGSQNIALIPGTTIPVSVNSTTNITVNSPYLGSSAQCTSIGAGSPFSQYYVNNNSGTIITHSGFTTVLQAIRAVTPCQTYHLKLAIADAFDHIYDSGVWLKAGSLTSTAISIQSIGGANLVAPLPYCIRNCQPGQFKFQRPAATASPITIHYLIQGSAINGTDYTFIPDSVTIPANAAFAVQDIYALAPPYGYDSVIIKVLSPYACGSTVVIIDSAKIYIRDSLITNILNSGVSICPGQSVQLNAQVFTGPTVFHSWSPAVGLSCTSCVSPIATPTVTTTYTLRDSIAGAGCTPGSDTVTITVTPAALPVVISPVNYCLGATNAVPLSATGTNIKWYLTATGGTGSTTAPTPLTTIAGTTIYYVSQTNTNNCESGRAPITVNVVAPPVITVSPTSANPCSGTPTTLTASGGDTYSWSPGTGLNTTTAATVTATPTAIITYTVTGTTTGPPACSSTATVTITPKPVPVVSFVSVVNPTTCVPQNGSLTLNGLSASTSYTYSYTLNGGTATTGTQTTSTSGQITLTGLGSGTYTGITATLNGCTSSAIGPYTLNSAPLPAAPAVSTNSPQCAGSTITLSAGTIAGATYAWSGPNGFTATGQTASVPNATTAASGTYSVTATVSGCTSPAGTATVIVNPIPTVPSVSTPVTYCVGAPSSALTAGGTNLKWYTVATGGTALNGAPIPSTAIAGTTTWYVSQTVSGCESPRAAVAVIINPLPLISVTPSIPTYCAGGSVSITASGAGGYTWSPATGLNTTSGATVTANGNSAQTYTVTGTDGNNCTNTATVTTVVNPLPVVTAMSNSPVCAGGPINLTATSATGTAFSWTGPGFTSAVQNPSIPNASTANAGTYTVTSTANGCNSAPAAISVVVNPNVTGTANAQICPGSTLNFGGTTINSAGTYTHHFSTSAGCDSFVTLTVTVSSSITTSFAAAVCSGQSYTFNGTTYTASGAYTAHFTAQNACDSASTLNLTVNPLPPAPVAPSPVIYCQNATAVPLTATTGSNLLWYTTAIGGIGNNTAPIPQTTIPGNTTWYVSQTVNSCESPRTAIIVTVNPNPAVSITPASAAICNGQSTQLTASGANAYTWTPGTGLNATTGNQVTASPTGTITYTVTGTNSFNCFATASATVTVNPVPVITASGNTPVCAGQTLNLIAVGATGGYVWTGPNAFSSTLQNPSIPSVTTSAGGTYTVTATVNNCTSAPVSTSVVVNPTKTSSLNVQLCNGSSYSFGGQTILSAGTYTHVFSTTLGCDSTVTLQVTVTTAIATNFSASICQGQTYAFNGTTYSAGGAYTAHFTAQNGCDSANTLNLTVNPLPAAPAVITPLNYCVGATAAPLTATGSNLKWYTVAVGGTGSTTAPIPSAATAGNTTWYVSQTTNSCEGPRAAITVNVNPNPVVTVLPAVPVICNGQNVVLTASGATTYTWTPGGGLSSTTGSPVTASPNGTTTYTVTGTTANCSSIATVTVTVNLVPTVSASSNTPVCSGGSINLTATGTAGSTYAWTGPGSYTSSTQNPTITAATVAAGGTYTVTATLNGCASLAAATTVVISPTPVISNVSGTNPTTCNLNNGTITISGLTANATYTIAYTANGTPVAAAGYTANGSSAITISGLAPGTYTSFVATLNGCASAPAGPVTLTAPSAPAVPVAAANSPICAGTTLNLSAASSTGGVTYNWSGPNSFSSALQNPSITNSTTAASGTYSVTASLAGCTSGPGTVSVVVNPIPATPVAGSNSPVCSGNTINLTAGNVTGATYAWSGPNSFGSALQNPSVNNATTTATGTYSVAVTVAGCISAAGTTAVIVNPTPVIGIISSSNPTGCGLNNGSITINGLTPNTAYTIAYTLNGTPVAGTTQITNGTGSITFSGLAPGTYSAFTATLNGCTSVATGSVTLVSPAAPATPVASSNSPLCAGSMLNLSATSSTGGVTYSWSGPNGFSSTQQSPSITGVTTAASGTYSVTAALAGCISAAGTVSVVVNPVPATPIVSSNTPVCSGNAINLTAGTISGATYAWTGPNTFSSTQQNPSIANATAAASGTYSVTATVLGCTSAAATASVTVNPTPVIASVTGTAQTNCAAPNGTITVSGLTPGATYTLSYTFNGNTVTGTFTASISGSIILTGLSSGTYTGFTATLNGCSSAVAGPVTIQAPAGVTAPTAAANSPCEGSTLSLTATTITGGTYSWAGPNGFSSVLQNPSIANATLASSGTYSVTVTVNGCTSPAGTVVVTIKPIPAVPVATSNSPVCAGNTLTLNAASSTTGVNYAWTGPNTFSSSVASPSITNAATAASGIYSVTASLNGCTSAAGTTIVTVNPLPGAPGVANVVYCQGETAIVLTASGSNLLWYTTATGGSPLNGAPLPSTAIATNYTWYVSQTVAGCEGPRAAITVTVNPKPAKPNGAPATVTYCQYETAVALSATGTNLLWYTTATGGTGNTTAPIPSTSVPGTYNFYVTQTAGGCESDRRILTVVVNAKPNLPTVTPVISYCQGDAAAPLSATGLNLKWYSTATGGAGSATAPLPNTQVAGNTFYYVSQTVAGCESNRAQIRVRVLEKPSGNISASHHLLCQEDTLTFYYNGTMPAGSVYNWQFPAGSTLLSGSGAGPMIVAFNTPGNFTVRLQVNDSGCMSAPMTYDVTIRPRPALHMVFKKDVCIDERVTVALNQATPGLHGYVWNFDGAQILSTTPDNSGPFEVSWHQPGIYTMTVVATNGECPSKPDTGIITVHELPMASILDKTSFGNICASDTITMHALDRVGYQYHWSPDIFFDMNGRATENARVQYSGYIFLNVQNEWSCRSVDSVLVQTHSCCTVTLPDAFSPNGDGRNDVFRMITPAVQSLSTFRIVNRWGQKIWETLRQDDSWDGTYNGVLQNTGVYHYYLKYRCADGKEYEQKGEFTLLR